MFLTWDLFSIFKSRNNCTVHSHVELAMGYLPSNLDTPLHRDQKLKIKKEQLFIPCLYGNKQTKQQQQQKPKQFYKK